MKRFLVIAVLLAAAVACSYEQKISYKATALHVALDVIKSNYILVSVQPDNDKVFYLIAPVKRTAYDECTQKMGKSDEYVMQAIIDSSRAYYNTWLGYAIRPDDKYIATFQDLMLYYAAQSRYFTGLTPDTEYYLCTFCVHPDKQIPIGSLSKTYFKTPAIGIEQSDMTFDFMFRNAGGTTNHCYIKPTSKSTGKICKDPYFADFVSEDDLKTYFEGCLNKYIEESLPYYKDFLMTDICRSMPRYMDDLTPGKKYIIFACPYISNWADHLYTLTFTFEPGLEIPYSHDSK